MNDVEFRQRVRSLSFGQRSALVQELRSPTKATDMGDALRGHLLSLAEQVCEEELVKLYGEKAHLQTLGVLQFALENPAKTPTPSRRKSTTGQLQLDALELPPELSIKDIAAYAGVSAKTVADRYVQLPDFPAPCFQVGRHNRRWNRDEVLTFFGGKPRRRR